MNSHLGGAYWLQTQMLTGCKPRKADEWGLLVELRQNLVVWEVILQVSGQRLPAAMRNPASKGCKMSPAMTAGLRWDFARPTSPFQHLRGLPAEVGPQIIVLRSQVLALEF